jgi:anti-sigma regulatory factor (Ser/Thr protein kinase)
MADRGRAGRRSGGRDSQDDGLDGHGREARSSPGSTGIPSRASHPADCQAPDAAHPPPLDQQFDVNSLGSLRAAVAAHAAAAGLAGNRVRDAVIAVHELAANVIRHGAGHGRIRQWTDGRRLHCQVSDPGRAAHLAAGTFDQRLWLTEHGHGLWLVRQVADHITIRRGLASADVTIIFAINPV